MNASSDVAAGWQWFALASALFAALTALLAKMGVTEVSSNLATLIRTGVVLVVAGAIVSWRGEWVAWSDVSRRGLAMLVLSGLATGLSWLCYFRALELAPVSLVAPVDKLSVALVAVLAVMLLGEPFSWKLLLGCGLVVGGVLVLTIG